jgi:hypothetical protein
VRRRVRFSISVGLAAACIGFIVARATSTTRSSPRTGSPSVTAKTSPTVPAKTLPGHRDRRELAAARKGETSWLTVKRSLQESIRRSPRGLRLIIGTLNLSDTTENALAKELVREGMRSDPASVFALLPEYRNLLDFALQKLDWNDVDPVAVWKSANDFAIPSRDPRYRVGAFVSLMKSLALAAWAKEQPTEAVAALRKQPELLGTPKYIPRTGRYPAADVLARWFETDPWAARAALKDEAPGLFRRGLLKGYAEHLGATKPKEAVDVIRNSSLALADQWKAISAAIPLIVKSNPKEGFEAFASLDEGTALDSMLRSLNHQGAFKSKDFDTVVALPESPGKTRLISEFLTVTALKERNQDEERNQNEFLKRYEELGEGLPDSFAQSFGERAAFGFIRRGEFMDLVAHLQGEGPEQSLAAYLPGAARNDPVRTAISLAERANRISPALAQGFYADWQQNQPKQAAAWLEQQQSPEVRSLFRP